MLTRIAFLMLFAAPAFAAPWSTRWTVLERSESQAGFRLTLNGSLSQVNQASNPAGAPRITRGSLIFLRTDSATYGAGIAAINSELQIDIQLVAGAAANALALRTTWKVAEKKTVGGSTTYPFYVKLITAGTDAAVASESTLEVYLADATAFGALTVGNQGSPVFVDFGACAGACLTGL